MSPSVIRAVCVWIRAFPAPHGCVVAAQVHAERSVSIVPAVLPPEAIRGAAVFQAVGINDRDNPDLAAVHPACDLRVLRIAVDQVPSQEKRHLGGDPFACVVTSHEQKLRLIFVRLRIVTDFHCDNISAFNRGSDGLDVGHPGREQFVEPPDDLLVRVVAALCLVRIGRQGDLSRAGRLQMLVYIGVENLAGQSELSDLRQFIQRDQSHHSAVADFPDVEIHSRQGPHVTGLGGLHLDQDGRPLDTAGRSSQRQNQDDQYRQMSSAFSPTVHPTPSTVSIPVLH